MFGQRAAGVRCVLPGDPWLEIACAELRKVERKVPHVALRVEDDGGNPRSKRFLDHADAEAGLARTRHADDDTVGCEMVGLVHHRFAGAIATVIDGLAQIETASFHVDHAKTPCVQMTRSAYGTLGR